LWETIYCPCILSLIKQIDRLMIGTNSGSDSYFTYIIDLTQNLISEIPLSFNCLSSLMKKWKFVRANVFLKLKDFDSAGTEI